MSLRRLALIAGAGEPDDALALRIDVVAAAEKVARTMDIQMRAKNPNANQQFALQGDVDLAVCELYTKTKRYMRACRRRTA